LWPARSRQHICKQQRESSGDGRDNARGENNPPPMLGWTSRVGGEPDEAPMGKRGGAGRDFYAQCGIGIDYQAVEIINFHGSRLSFGGTTIWFSSVEDGSSLVEIEFLSEPVFRLVKSQRDSVDRTTKHSGGLGVAELLPKHETQHVSIRGLEAADRRLHLLPGAQVLDLDFEGPAELEATKQPGAPPYTTFMSAQNPTGYSVDPQSILRRFWYLIHPTPRSGKNLGRYV
jgi:hypothetical protein